ncbi:MAG: hypothetical protein ABII22_03180 [Candidatus Micrarchaeota archaeon]
MVTSPTLRKEYCSICKKEFSTMPPNSTGGFVEFKETKAFVSRSN